MIMKKRGALGWALMSSMAVLPLSATICALRVLAAPAPSNAESELRVIYKNTEKAFFRRDAKAVIALETPDYRTKNNIGEITTKSRADINLREFMKSVASFRKVKFEVIGVTTFGNKAMIPQRQHIDATLRYPGIRKTAHLVNDSLFHDTWIKTPRGWRIQLSHLMSSKTSVDGRRIE